MRLPRVLVAVGRQTEGSLGQVWGGDCAKRTCWRLTNTGPQLGPAMGHHTLAAVPPD